MNNENRTKKVAIVCPYSFPSACGIWARAYSDAKALIKEGYEVHAYTATLIKGTTQHSSNFEEFEGIKIHRFKPILSLGENALFWPQVFFAILKSDADYVHVHGYRHPHTVFAQFAAILKGKKTFITTHGPFEKDPREPLILKLFTRAFDVLIGWWQLKLFNKVIRITNWEEKYLKRLGYFKSILIPNGIKKIFIKDSVENSKQDRILFMSRVDPVKRPEWIINLAKKLPEYKFRIVGPLHGYPDLKSESSNLEIELRKYSPEEFISQLDSSDIFLLPSIRESFGIVILEAMARGKIVISTNTKGPMDFLKDSINGFVINSEEEMLEKVRYVYSNWENLQTVRESARLTAIEYSEDKTTQALLKLYSN